MAFLSTHCGGRDKPAFASQSISFYSCDRSPGTPAIRSTNKVDRPAGFNSEAALAKSGDRRIVLPLAERRKGFQRTRPGQFATLTAGAIIVWLGSRAASIHPGDPGASSRSPLLLESNVAIPPLPAAVSMRNAASLPALSVELRLKASPLPFAVTGTEGGQDEEFK